MKLSYNWLTSYIDIQQSPEELERWLTALGLEVEGTESYESIKGGLRGVVTGHVLTKEQHPNADRLSVTTVDVGGDEPLHIVCGAPNVAAGQKVLVATIGTEIHLADGESFTIKKSKIRGERSEGMICAEDELGLGKSHDGILVLPEETQIGLPASELFPVEVDTIYEIGLTPNRSDATAHLGSARDVAAGLGFHEGRKIAVNLPALKKDVGDNQLDFTVQVDDARLCPRYCGLIVNDITVGDSPAWLKTRLESIGVRSINNIVDITNFVLHEFGQPLHAFDLEKIEGNGIVVKNLPAGTKFLSLDDVERSLHEDDLMICDAAGNPMCIAGVFGGSNSGVTTSTTSIFLESAHFNAESIRRTSMRHVLRTDAAKVFEKGSDPNIAEEAMWRAANLMQELCGATISLPVFDLYPSPILKKAIQVRTQRVNQVIGIDLSRDELASIFDHLHMTIDAEDDESFTVLIPTDKSEVLREVDVIEEILRIYGYDRVPVSAKLKTSIVHADQELPSAIRNEIIQRLNARGYHQAMNLSLSRSAYYGDEKKDLVYIVNTSNSHLDIMRADLIHSSLETVSHNSKYQNRNLKLFEFGSAYAKTDDDYREEEYLAITMTGQHDEAHWATASLPTDYFALKSTLVGILPSAYQHALRYNALEDELFDFGQAILHSGQRIGRMGRLSSSKASSFDIDAPVYYLEIKFSAIFSAWTKNEITYQPISKFPGTQRDIALVVDETITYDQIASIVTSVKNKKIVGTTLFDIYRHDEHIGKGKKSMAIRFDFVDENKTLQDKEIDKMINKLVGSFKHHLGAELR